MLALTHVGNGFAEQKPGCTPRNQAQGNSWQKPPGKLSNQIAWAWQRQVNLCNSIPQ
jgi:hypothetical protein